MSELTKKQKQIYIKSGGVICPFCDSYNLRGIEEVNIVSGIGTQIVHCEKCEKDWIDIYKLIDIDTLS